MMEQKFSLQSQTFILILFIFTGLFFVGQVLIALLIAVFMPNFSIDNYDEASVGLNLIAVVSSQAGLFIMAFWAYLKLMKQKAKDVMWLDKINPKWMLYTVLSILVIIPLVGLLSSANISMVEAFPSTGWIEMMEQKEATLLELFSGNKAYFVVFVLCFAVLPAFVEEFIFRGLLFRKFMDVSGGNLHFAAWTSALIFGAIHFQPWALIPMVAMGGLFAYIYHKTKSIWYSVVLHALFNATTLIVYTYFPELNF